MWKMKTKIIPVIVGTLGMVKKGAQKYFNETPANLSLDETWYDQKGNTEIWKYVNEIPGNLPLAEIQKIVSNSTAHILRRTCSL